MKTRSQKISSEIAQEFGYINKPEVENEAQSSGHSFEDHELGYSLKVKKHSESAGDLKIKKVIVHQRKLVEFESNDALHTFSKNHLQTVKFEKIPKSETKIQNNKQSSFSDAIYNNYGTHSDDDLNTGPDRDPFADIDIDLSFSQNPTSTFTNVSTTQEAHSINTVDVDVYDSSNSPSAAKRTPPTVKHESCTTTSDHKLRPFKCLKCTRRFKTASYLKYHMKSHSPKLTAACPVPTFETAFKLEQTVEEPFRIQTHILGDELPSPGDEEDDRYNISIFNEKDLKCYPERDPFEDIGCDPSFSQKLESNSPNDSATQVQLVNGDDITHSSNPPSPFPAKPILPTASAFKHYPERKKVADYFQCQLCLETLPSKSELTTHLEICAESHKNRSCFCVLCNTLFSSFQAHKKHAVRMHGG